MEYSTRPFDPLSRSVAKTCEECYHLVSIESAEWVKPIFQSNALWKNRIVKHILKTMIKGILAMAEFYIKVNDGWEDYSID